MIPHTADLVVLFHPIVEHHHTFHSHGGNIVSFFFFLSTFTSNDFLCSYFKLLLFSRLCFVLIARGIPTPVFKEQHFVHNQLFTYLPIS